jgi:flagellar biosynthesis protein FlhG
MTLLHPVASGKGGVGKTAFVANLGVLLAMRRKTVVLVDLDLGGSNLHTMLGVKNRHAGLGGFIAGKESSFAALPVETGVDRLFLIPGDGLLPGTANLPYFVKRRIMKGIQTLDADFVILDLGAGTSFNVADFWLMSSTGILVITPEITSILNAYSLLKTVLFRLLLLSFPPKSPQRAAIAEFSSNRIEGSSLRLPALLDTLHAMDAESGQKARNQLARLYPKVLMNMGGDAADIAMCGKLREIAEKNLALDVEYLGLLPMAPEVPRSVQDRHPLALSRPESAYCRAVDGVASRLLELRDSPSPVLHEPGEDLEALSASMDTIS